MPHRRQLLQAALAAGLAPAFVRHARAGAGDDRFAYGVASGQPQARTVVLWTRLAGAGLTDEVNVTWELAEDEAFRRIAARGTELAHAAEAHSVHAEPRGLAPDRWYWYRFAALGQRSRSGRTRTAPAADARVAQLRFVIASCQRFDSGHYAAWRHAAAEAPDLVLFLGDYIYEYPAAAGAVRRYDDRDGPVLETSLQDLGGYRARYAQTRRDPDLQAAHAAAPWLLVWDDHEVENDYAGLQGNRLQPAFAAQRAAAYQAYWEHMPLPKSARPVDGAMRMFGSLDWGLLARIHLLDDRQQRDPQACNRPGRGGSSTAWLADCPALLDPRRTLLGAAQERWLAGNWSLAQPWNLLAQQTLMARAGRTDGPPAAIAATAEVAAAAAAAVASTSASASAASGGDRTEPAPPRRYWTDGWDGYPAARERLLATVAERRVPGVVVLGGDVHANVVADVKAGPPAAWDDPAAPTVASEFCGTSITSAGGAQSQMDLLRGANPHLHHARSDGRGYVAFTLRPGLLHAELRVLDDVRSAASGIRTDARFAVDPLEPGIRAG